MTYCDVEYKEILKVITQEELNFVKDLRIPYHGATAGLWAKKYFIDEKIYSAIRDGIVKAAERPKHSPTKARFHVNSDYVAGGAVKSMADGKMYDSKSTYYKSLKENGYHIMDEPPKQHKREIESDITGRDIKDAIERIKSR